MVQACLRHGSQLRIDGRHHKGAGNLHRHWQKYTFYYKCILELFEILTFFSEGPKYEDYQFNLVPDSQTRTDIDLGALGGPRKAVAKFQGNDLVTELHKLEDDVVDVIATRSIDPANPNVMTYTLTDVESGYKLIQKLNRQ